MFLTILLLILTVADIGLAALLVAVSGFVFGAQEGLGGDPLAVAEWSIALAACLAAPVFGFVLRRRGRAGWGVLAAAIPPLVGFMLSGITPG